jgi:hypothetical protein
LTEVRDFADLPFIPDSEAGKDASFVLFQFPNNPTESYRLWPRSVRMIKTPMNQPQQSERTRNSRRYQRYELETELKAVILGVQHREMRGRSLNINEGGIAGVFVTGWNVGTPVDLQFTVPITTVPIRVKGIVRNCTGYRYGFEFADLTAQERETITRTCRTLDLLE